MKRSLKYLLSIIPLLALALSFSLPSHATDYDGVTDDHGADHKHAKHRKAEDEKSQQSDDQASVLRAQRVSYLEGVCQQCLKDAAADSLEADEATKTCQDYTKNVARNQFGDDSFNIFCSAGKTHEHGVDR